MKRIRLAEYRRLTSGAKVLSRDGHGEKVLLTPTGRIVKLFRRKRFLSSAWWRPYAMRFLNASRGLTQRGVRTVTVEAVYRVRAIRRDVVVYWMIPGRTLREALADDGEVATLLTGLAVLMAQLHKAGVYFRAIHFGNVLVQIDGSLALIDVSEASIGASPLDLKKRVRNFRPLRSYDEDAAKIDEFGAGNFVKCYLEHAKLTPQQEAEFRNGLRRVDRRWGADA